MQQPDPFASLAGLLPPWTPFVSRQRPAFGGPLPPGGMQQPDPFASLAGLLPPWTPCLYSLRAVPEGLVMNGPLLRAPVLWLTEQPWFRRLAAEGSLGRRVALRFVAGEMLEDALGVARVLDRRGVATMLDH